MLKNPTPKPKRARGSWVPTTGQQVTLCDVWGFPRSIHTVARVYVTTFRLEDGRSVGVGRVDGGGNCEWKLGAWLVRQTVVDDADRIARLALVSRIAGTRGDAWAALPLESLREVVAILDRPTPSAPGSVVGQG